MFLKLRSAISICATLTFLGAVCVEATVPASPQESEAVIVKMTAEHKFVPEKITIKVGQTVEWVNDDTVKASTNTHEVTTDPDIAVDPSHVSMPSSLGTALDTSKSVKTVRVPSEATPGKRDIVFDFISHNPKVVGSNLTPATISSRS